MNGTHETKPSDLVAERAARASGLLKQLANTKRLEILCVLSKGESPVGTLVEQVSLSQSAVSQHLAKMRKSGLVRCEKRGTMAYYSIASMEVSALLSTLYLIYCRD